MPHRTKIGGTTDFKITRPTLQLRAAAYGIKGDGDLPHVIQELHRQSDYLRRWTPRGLRPRNWEPAASMPFRFDPASRQIVFDSFRMETPEIAQLLINLLTAFPGMTLRLTTDVLGELVELRHGMTREEIIPLIRGLLGRSLGRDDSETPSAELSPSSVHTATLNADLDWPISALATDASILPISIYLADEGIHKQVETAVEDLLATANLRVWERDEPIIGSWFRRMRAWTKQSVHSPTTREAALAAAHAVDSRVNLAQDAMVTATLLQNLGPVIASLQPTKDAVLRVGALLVVKVNWVVQVFQLTAAQQAILDHQPQLTSSPHEIIAALQLSIPSLDGVPPAMKQE